MEKAKNEKTTVAELQATPDLKELEAKAKQLMLEAKIMKAQHQIAKYTPPPVKEKEEQPVKEHFFDAGQITEIIVAIIALIIGFIVIY